MSARVYLLLDVKDDRGEQAAVTIGSLPGVIYAECLEGHPNVMALMESTDREKLASLVMPVLAAVETVAEDVRVLVPRYGAAAPAGAGAL